MRADSVSGTAHLHFEYIVRHLAEIFEGGGHGTYSPLSIALFLMLGGYRLPKEREVTGVTRVHFPYKILILRGNL
jgi:hypothetical protein